MSHVKDSVLKILDDRRNETVGLLRELIMTPSPSGEENAVAELIGKRLTEFGFDNVEIDGLHNVICKIEGSHGSHTLLYNGHTDVVPLGDLSLWPADPRKAPIVDDKVIGRGGCDMKGSIAAMMMAADAVKKAGVKLRGNLILTMVSREEGGLQEGTKYTIEKGGLKPDIGLIGEATNLDLCLGSRGRIAVEVSVKGKSAHAANPSRGINAIVKMNKMIDAIENMKLPTHEILGPTSQAITNITCQPGQLNMVPNLCSISIDRRIAPGDSLEKTKAEFRAIIDQIKTQDPEFDADVETGKLAIPGYKPPEEPVVELLRESAKHILGKSPRVSHYIFGTDGSYLSGVKSIAWFGFGPGDEANAHTVKDHVKIDDLIAASKVYALFIIELLS